MPAPTNNSDFVLIKGDCRNIISTLKNKVDMIFADPPYFLSSGKGTIKIEGRYINFDKGDWDKQRTREEIYNFNKEWLTPCYNILKDSGTIWVCGTYHNIFEVANCMKDLGFIILNIIIWKKTDPPPTFTHQRFNFSAEYIIWAKKSSSIKYFYNYDLMKKINHGVQMPDVWELPSVSSWEKKCGKHPTQKPLRLLYRIILSTTKSGETILDPFAGSCTTGIAANLLGRNFIGIEQDETFINLGYKRKYEINNNNTAHKIYRLMCENPNEEQVLVNNVRSSLLTTMIENGITYLRAGDTKGSLLITSGFERMQYVFIHTNGENCHLFKLKKKGCFQIWTKETLETYGFKPEHSKYYIVLHFEKKDIPFTYYPKLKQGLNSYRSKIRPLSDFIGIE